jgi:hypothetical protein
LRLTPFAIAALQPALQALFFYLRHVHFKHTIFIRYSYPISRNRKRKSNGTLETTYKPLLPILLISLYELKFFLRILTYSHNILIFINEVSVRHLKLLKMLEVEDVAHQRSIVFLKNMDAHWISTRLMVVYPPMSLRIYCPYFPSFNLSMRWRPEMLPFRVNARMVKIIPASPCFVFYQDIK